MGIATYSQEAPDAVLARIESRKQAEQASAESDVERSKARFLASMTGLDIAENFDTDAVTAAIRIGDPALIGRLALMCLEQLATRCAIREVFGYQPAIEDEEIGMQMVNDFVRARAGVTQ